jgi:hypothetical protein
MKLQPLQIWLPKLGPSIKKSEISRDATRAFENFRGDERVVWMIPEITRPARWKSDDVVHLAVPSEEFDRIDIVHISEEGRLYAAPTVGVPATVDGLLDAWLNVGGPSFVPPSPPISIKRPHPNEDGTISWMKRTVSFDPANYLPISAVDSEGREATMIWPLSGSPSPVSPEAESARQYSSEKFDSDSSIAVTEQGDMAAHVFLRWPGVLEHLMPLLSGPDDMFALAQMMSFARQSATDLPGALKAASIAAQPYLFNGNSTVEHMWFRPLLQQKGRDALFLRAEGRGLLVPPKLNGISNEDAIKELPKIGAWQKELAKPIPVRRAWGAVGLFWTLFLDRLEVRRSFNSCELCGRIIQGTDAKRFCSQTDNNQCFSKRRAQDKRLLRKKRASRVQVKGR